MRTITPTPSGRYVFEAVEVAEKSVNLCQEGLQAVPLDEPLNCGTQGSAYEIDSRYKHGRTGNNGVLYVDFAFKLCKTSSRSPGASEPITIVAESAAARHTLMELINRKVRLLLEGSRFCNHPLSQRQHQLL
eukprot:COSAG01_NODE_26032_length_725_cov_1.648562_1_plen_131_part_10